MRYLENRKAKQYNSLVNINIIILRIELYFQAVTAGPHHLVHLGGKNWYRFQSI